jgi:hypothetical protein
MALRNVYTSPAEILTWASQLLPHALPTVLSCSLVQGTAREGRTKLYTEGVTDIPRSVRELSVHVL